MIDNELTPEAKRRVLWIGSILFAVVVAVFIGPTFVP